MQLGVIADDLTGATDVALMLTVAGLRTLQVMDAPTAATNLDGYDAVVVALKSRTIAPEIALAQSLQALEALRARGANQILFKYCSTFDSTPVGNIGPVADALMDRLGADVAIVCPAFPRNGRTIYKGHLFVGDSLLSDSPMKDHPLTPMLDSSLVRLMQAQTRRKVGLIPLAIIDLGPDAIRTAIKDASAAGFSYVVTDALIDRHLIDTGIASRGMALVTGGSGIAMGLHRPVDGQTSATRSVASAFAAPAGRQAVLAGSCSRATRDQIAFAKAAGFPTFEIDAREVVAGNLRANDIVRWFQRQDAQTTAVIFSSADPDVVAALQMALGRDRAGHAIEAIMAETARALVGHGVTRLIVAGGETSGAVVQGLGIKALEIGPEIAPGVPWTRTQGSPALVIALKSGNFGGPAFFSDAFRQLASC